MSQILASFSHGFATSGALIIAIGAQNMFVLRQGLRREHVAPIVLFCALSDAVLISAGVAGMGTALSLVPGLSLALSLGGAAFLAWYAVGAFRRAAAPGAMQLAGGAGLSLGAALGTTAALTFLNPHVYLDTVLLMGTLGAAVAPELRPVFVAGAVTSSIVWFFSLGFGARFLTPLFARPQAWRLLDTLVGTVMALLALGLLNHALGGL